MSFKKFATVEAQILETRSAPERIEGASLARFSNYNDFRTDDGYIYTRVRAISSRVNKNFDGWPSEELGKAYRSFIGKPIYVDHHNSDPDRSRGVIVDAILHVEDDRTSSLDPYYATAPENHKPHTWIELLLETDAKAFPKLAKAIVDKDIDGVSMGCNVEKTRCSICSNWASDPMQFCSHVKLKGAHFDSYDNMGKKNSKLAYEDCYDIGFFEISYVFDPADETALVHEVKTAAYGDDDEPRDVRPEDWENGETIFDSADPRNRSMMSPLSDYSDWMLNPADPAHAAEMQRRRDQAKQRVLTPRPQPMADDVWNAGPAPHEPSAAERVQDPFTQYLQDNAAQSEFQNADGSPVDTQSDLDSFQHPDDPRAQAPASQGDFDPNDPHDAQSLGPNWRGGDPVPGWIVDVARDAMANGMDEETAIQHMTQSMNITPAQAQMAIWQTQKPTDPREGSTKEAIAHWNYCPSCKDGLLKVALEYGKDGFECENCDHFYSSGDHFKRVFQNHASVDQLLAGIKLADNPLPQSMELSVPEHVDTLRQEKVCPICGSEMDDGECAVCHYVEPPAGFDNPDLGLAQQVRDMIEQSGENLAQGGQPPMMGGGPDMGGAPGNAGDPMPGTPGPPQPGTMASTKNPSDPQEVRDEWEVAVRARVASRIDKRELPILPPTRFTSDLPVNPKVIQNSSKPVESNTKDTTNNMSDWNTVASNLQKRGLDVNKVSALVEAGVFEKLLERLGADAVAEPADFANTDIDSRAQLGGDPTKDADHIDVEKPLKEEVGDHTKTWGDNSAPTVTPDDGSVGQGPIGSPIHSKDKTANPIPGSEIPYGVDAVIDVEKPLNKEEVGEPTKTWGSDDFHITDPITTDGNGNQGGGPIGTAISSAKAHWMKALKVAETEIELGILPPEEKYDRLAILEGQTPEQVEAVGQTLAMVRKANLKRTKTVPKAPPGLGATTASTKTASVEVDDSALFYTPTP